MKIRTWLIGLFTSGNRPQTQLGVGDVIVHEHYGECEIIGGALNVRILDPNHWVCRFGSGVTINLKDFVD